jgi:hypothetical protein
MANRIAYVFKLEREDSRPADPPTFRSYQSGPSLVPQAARVT